MKSCIATSYRDFSKQGKLDSTGGVHSSTWLYDNNYSNYYVHLVYTIIINAN